MRGDPSNQIYTRGDVAPLIRSSGLQCAVVLLMQLQVVVRLQKLVTELGVRDALSGQARGDGLAIKHSIDAEMLPDVTQELQR